MIIGFFKKKEEEEDTNGGGWVLAMKRRNGGIMNEGWWTCGVVWKMLIQGYNERGGMGGLFCISLIMLESGRNGTGDFFKKKKKKKDADGDGGWVLAMRETE
ncbi:unnamed protein product [Fusarium graminearum]|uniref:Uncharacterized protein n=1 Tax=Gibberella zeae TaxID=5518 RepID=A0A4E9DR02_GIBZA|nr:unnamed protein product [Fusarium graminearum]CAF3492633.1 unnamed protein product [Fusarium graminearum]CAG1976819.1 unnamed protein product [Fusarium graminearum]